MNIYPPGTLIAGRYEVASRPMMGGMGIVYVCFDHQDDRPVALKTFKPEYLPDRAARDRFLREGTAWVDLGAHPHVVRCYTVEHIDISSEVYLVLELIAKAPGYPDASLRSWLAPGRPLPVETALLFALQIARGMQHAVERIPGFVHRDLKPENVLVGADKLPGADVNRLRVTDFGLAAILEAAGQRIGDSAEPRETDTDYALRSTQLTHGIVGTPLYMAPEQWLSEAVGVYTDVYALGCLLYEMLTGQRAAAGDSLAALQRAHCAGGPRLLPAALPEAARACVTGCLAREAGARYATWEAALAAVAGAYQAVAGQGAPAGLPAAALSRAEQVAHGWSYNAMGAAYLDLGKAGVAAGYFERAGAVGAESGERALVGTALGNLGLAYADLGEVRRAIGYYEQGLAIGREIGGWREEGAALGNLGVAYYGLGEVRRAIGYYEQYLTIAREIGDRRGEGTALGNLGNAYLQLGEVRRAIGYYEQAITIRREIGDMQGVATDAFNMALLYQQQGDPVRALPLAQEAARIWTQIESPYAQRAQQLAAQLGGAASTPGGAAAAPGSNAAQAAFEAFQRAGAPDAMREAAARFPLMTAPGFIAAVEQVIAEQVSPEDRPAFEQRLAWLRQIAGGR